MVWKRIVMFVLLLMIGFASHASIAEAKGQIIKVRITDFWRSPTEQAHLLQKLKNNGVNLSKLYKQASIIKEIEEADSVELIEIIIRKYINQGEYLSKHLCGKSLDVAKDKGVKDFIAFISNSSDIDVLDEGDHYHLQITTRCNK